MALTQEEQKLRYEVLVYGLSAMIAARCKQDERLMRVTLSAAGVKDNNLLDAVAIAQQDTGYTEETDGRGLTYNEGVYEAIKDCLRPVFMVD